MPGKVRRIVTGLNDRGQSTIISDSQLPAQELAPGERVRAGMWVTDSVPASNTAPDPVPDGNIQGIPPKARGGSVFRITDIPPDDQMQGNAQQLAAMGVHVSEERSSRHHGFHMTDTIDYAICLEGEVWAVLDDTETLMKPGDVLIQRGTYHAWSNRTNQMARMAFVLIDAEPLQHG
jgi:quercetin dioxygenase-like cupin family protein